MKRKYQIGCVFNDETIKKKMINKLNDFTLAKVNYESILYVDLILTDNKKSLSNSILFICDLFAIPIVDLDELTANDFDNSLKEIINKKATEKATAIDYELECLLSLVKINIIEEKNKRGEVGHGFRVAYYAKLIANKLNLSDVEINEIYIAALLHDLGKIYIPETIINKPEPLNKEEYNFVKQHPAIGIAILPNMLFTNIRDIIYEHHERMDGSGYPNGLKNNDICLGARIIGLVDSFDAMTSKRVYGEVLKKEQALKELAFDVNVEKYDKEVFASFIELLK